MPDSPQDLAVLLAGAEHAVASMSTFRRAPERFWAFHRPRIDMLTGVEPNATHRVLAELERRGVVKALITQNIDRLHTRAGSVRVIEVHGSLDRGACLRCDAEVAMDELLIRADAAADGVPRCTACGYQLKSGVVLFGEELPAAAIDAASGECGRADVLLVIGSSLLVHPVAGLPGLVLGRGGRLAILTESETPWDDRAAIRIHDRAGPAMTAVLQELDRLAA